MSNTTPFPRYFTFKTFYGLALLELGDGELNSEVMFSLTDDKKGLNVYYDMYGNLHKFLLWVMLPLTKLLDE